MSLLCQFVHNRYCTAIASHLLCQLIRWDPPPEPTIGDTSVSSVNWLQVPVNQLKSRLSKIDLGVIKACCDQYLSPESPPKPKTGKYSVVVERFRSCLILLFEGRWFLGTLVPGSALLTPPGHPLTGYFLVPALLRVDPPMKTNKCNGNTQVYLCS